MAASCKCGAAILKAVTPAGEPLILEGHSEPVGGPGYFAVLWETDPVTAIEITVPNVTTGHPDHKLRCPFNR